MRGPINRAAPIQSAAASLRARKAVTEHETEDRQAGLKHPEGYADTQPDIRENERRRDPPRHAAYFLAAPEETVRPPGKPERGRCGAILLAGT